MSFDSMQSEDIDYFIVENKSKYSTEIEDYFKDKRLKGYIQFEENIGANALNIFIKEYENLLKEYKYITITDGDVYIYDFNSLLYELKEGLNHSNCLISSAHVYYGNVPDSPHRIMGIEQFNKFTEGKKEEKLGTFEGGNSGVHLLTFKSKNLNLIKSVYFNDHNIAVMCEKNGYKWRNTNRNKVYHLSWDLLGWSSEYQIERGLGDDNMAKEAWVTTKECNYKTIV